jgi:hypothetical protein
MTTSCFAALVHSTAERTQPPKRTFAARLSSSLDYYCQYPLDRFIKGFADGAMVHFRRDFPVLSADAWTDRVGMHVRLGRIELEVFRKRTPEARVATALDDAQSRYDYGGGIWDEMVALGIKEKVGAPARELIYQGRWAALDAWVVQRRAMTAQGGGA